MRLHSQHITLSHSLAFTGPLIPLLTLLNNMCFLCSFSERMASISRARKFFFFNFGAIFMNGASLPLSLMPDLIRYCRGINYAFRTGGIHHVYKSFKTVFWLYERLKFKIKIRKCFCMRPNDPKQTSKSTKAWLS